MPASPVVLQLLIINVLVYFVAQFLFPDASHWLAMYFPGTQYFRPFQIVSYMFMHGSITHLFFNMFALYTFGTPLEYTLGPKKFLFLYFFTGFGALALYLLVQYYELINYGTIPNPVVGASGAIFGLMAGFGILYPNQILQLLFPPIALKAKYFVLIFGALEVYLGIGHYNTGVAHFAHVGGALFGAILIYYWKRNRSL